MKACRVCGCEDLNACWDEEMGMPCHWVQEDLCSVCARKVGGEMSAEIQGKLGMLMAAVGECLMQNLSPVLIVLENDERPGDFSVHSGFDQETLQKLLQRLVSRLPDIPTSEVQHRHSNLIVLPGQDQDDPFGRN